MEIGAVAEKIPLTIASANLSELRSSAQVLTSVSKSFSLASTSSFPPSTHQTVVNSHDNMYLCVAES